MEGNGSHWRTSPDTAGRFLILIQYGVTFLTALFLQLQLFVIFIGWWHHSPWGSCSPNSPSCHISCRTVTLLQSSKVISVWLTLTRIMKWEFPYISQYWSCVYSKIIRSQLSSTVPCASSAHLTTPHDSAENWITPLYCDMNLKS